MLLNVSTQQFAFDVLRILVVQKATLDRERLAWIQSFDPLSYYLVISACIEQSASATIARTNSLFPTPRLAPRLSNVNDI